MQITNQRENIFAGVGVEVAGRFVGEQNRRVNRERAGDGDALALAARQFFWQVRHPVAELDQRQQLGGAFVHLRARPASQVEREPDVLKTRQGRQEIEELKNEPDLVAPDPRELVVREAGQRLAVDAHLARGRTVEAAHKIEQRRLARARGADDRHHLAARDGQRDVLERGHLTFAGKLFGDAGDIVDHTGDYVKVFTSLSVVSCRVFSTESAPLSRLLHPLLVELGIESRSSTRHSRDTPLLSNLGGRIPDHRAPLRKPRTRSPPTRRKRSNPISRTPTVRCSR